VLSLDKAIVGPIRAPEKLVALAGACPKKKEGYVKPFSNRSPTLEEK
jgi:hypothetical protein